MDNHQQNQHRNKVAFVLGNGRSRLAADLKTLKTYGTVFGCNALYREFDPDFLIAVDVKMINEIIAAGYHNRNSVWTNPNKGVNTKNNINFFTPHKGWSSGPTALWMSTQKSFREIYILGFDYQGVNGKFNNVYADTFNYKRSTDSPTFHGNWLSQTDRVIKENPSIKFYRVIEKDSFIPDQLKVHPNLQHIDYAKLNKNFVEKDI
jgi:hypothetical protein